MIPGPARALATCLLLLAFAVFLLGETLLVRSTRTADGSPGLWISDVQAQFAQGSRSLLEARIRTDMREHLDDGEYTAMLAWIRAGASEQGYQRSIGAVFEDRCVRCHKEGGSAAFRPLETRAQIAEALAEPPSPPLRSMVVTTKIHLVGLGALIAIPALIVSRSRRPRLASLLVWAAYGGLGLDFASWWGMRLGSIFALGRVVGHAVLLLAFFALAAAALKTLWWRREEAG